jgi:hypothetical protein
MEEFASAGAEKAVRIQGEHSTQKLTAGTTQAAQVELQFFRLLNGMSLEQVVNTLIRSDERQAVEKFESLLGENAGGTQVHDTQGGLMGELQGRRAERSEGECPAQPVRRSQVSKRKCSGTSSQMPTRLPETLSARSWRTPGSTLR